MNKKELKKKYPNSSASYLKDKGIWVIHFKSEDLLKITNEITWGKNKDIASIKPYLSTKVVKVKRNGPFPKQNIQNT